MDKVLKSSQLKFAYVPMGVSVPVCVLFRPAPNQLQCSVVSARMMLIKSNKNREKRVFDSSTP